MFLWRLVHNIVPSVGNLKGKVLLMEDKCCVCRMEGETTMDVMFECELSKAIWNKTYPKVKKVLDAHRSGNFWHVLFQYLYRDNNLELCLITFWLI